MIIEIFPLIDFSHRFTPIALVHELHMKSLDITVAFLLKLQVILVGCVGFEPT